MMQARVQVESTTGGEFMQARLVLAAATFIMISCGNNTDSNFCELMDGNYLQDPGFNQRTSAGRLQFWGGRQHAGEDSFDLTFDDGELTIDKIGTQPWMSFRQTVEATELAGKKLAMNAELKLDLQQPRDSHPTVVGGGLKIAARAGGSKGRKLLLRSNLDHQPRLGKTDWYPVQVVVQLPENTSTVEVGFLHQADGTLQIRNPSFQLVDESSRPCEVSPNAVLGVSQASSPMR
jgi:hypothetical protein